jgi:hypothetical protein
MHPPAEGPFIGVERTAGLHIRWLGSRFAATSCRAVMRQGGSETIAASIERHYRSLMIGSIGGPQ